MYGEYMHNLHLKFIWSYDKIEKGSKYKTSLYEYIVVFDHRGLVYLPLHVNNFVFVSEVRQESVTSIYGRCLWGWHSPLLVRSIQGVFRRYAVRNGSVRRTHKFCFIVRRHNFLVKKDHIFIKKHNKIDIQSEKQSEFFARSFRSRRFWGISIFF